MDRIGPYRVLRKLGEGGMGIVYAAEDERLHRAVAIKTIRDSVDDSSRERLIREARAAASVSHPNVCQLYDIGDEDGRPFLVMELLEGASLVDRLRSGPMPLPDAVQVALSILTALDALHARGFIHRDLKPSNVFLCAHSVKLLDFGLAREAPRLSSPDDKTMSHASTPLTASGMIIGTPRYMAPEQLLGAPVDARTDLFAVGTLLYEMIAGAPPFDDPNVMKLFHAVVYENAPNLTGSAAITAVNRIVQRALAKRADQRYASAAAMAADLRDVMLISDAAAPVVARRITRLVVLPLRILRSDAETDFLAYAIPEAITTTLASLGSLVLRSSAAAAKLVDLDPKQLAEAADVDVALQGTLLRANDQIRVTSQLVELPSGTVIWSQSAQTTMADVFELQDRLTQRIVSSLELPLSEREARLMHHDVPATPRAHEFYLRAGQQGESPEAWMVARDLYQRATEEDPRYAPAWARLARIYLLLGKYVGETEKNYKLAESAAQHAMELNPDLATAHDSYAKIEVATGRAVQAMVRLLDRVAAGTNDAEVYAALITACRFCGLLDASAAAYAQVKRLDPHQSTSAAHTLWMMGRYDEALAAVDRDRDFGADEAFILESMGRIDEALTMFDDRERRLVQAGARPGTAPFAFISGFRAVLLRDAAGTAVFDAFEDFPDPEGLFYMARCCARMEQHDRAIEVLGRSVSQGFTCFPIFARDPWLDPLRKDPRFLEILRRAESKMREAARAFEEHPGSRVLNVG